MGFYLILPFFLTSTFIQSTSSLQLLYRVNFIIQWILVAQLLTGGYLYSQGTYSMLWTVLMIIIFLGIGAFGGIFGYYVRHFMRVTDPSEFQPWIKKFAFMRFLPLSHFGSLFFLWFFLMQCNRRIRINVRQTLESFAIIW
jgi:hypothetical protein